MSLEDLYRAVIMDHYQHPRNKGRLIPVGADGGAEGGACAGGAGTGEAGADDSPANDLHASGVRIVQLTNPTCGDEIELGLLVEDGIIKDVRFLGHGCSISMASASMMTEAIKGKPTSEAMALLEDFKCMVKGEDCDKSRLGDLEALAGVAKFPARYKCATLAWNALARGINDGGDERHSGGEPA